MPRPLNANLKPLNAYHHGDLYLGLIQSALGQVEKQGAERVTIVALAKELRVSQPAFYRHFPDREALLSAVAAEGFRAFISALRDVADDSSGQNILERMALAYVAFARQRSHLYRLMFSSRLVANAEAESHLKETAEESFGVFLEAFEGEGSTRQRARSAMSIWTTLHGMVCLEQQGLIGNGKDTADVTIEMMVEDLIANRRARAV